MKIICKYIKTCVYAKKTYVYTKKCTTSKYDNYIKNNDNTYKQYCEYICAFVECTKSMKDERKEKLEKLNEKR